MAFSKFQGLTLLLSLFVVCLLNAKSYDFAEEAVAYENMNELLEGEMPAEVKQVTNKFLRMLPRDMSFFKDPKFFGSIAALIVAALSGTGIYLATREPSDLGKYAEEKLEVRMKKEIDPKLPETEKTEIKAARDAISKKIKDLVTPSDVKSHQDGAAEAIKKLKTALSETGTKAPELYALLSAISSGKEAKHDPAVEYTKPMADVITKPEDKKISDETKNFVAHMTTNLKNLVDDYNAAVEAKKELKEWINILGFSDSDLKLVDFTKKPADIKKGEK